MSVTFYGSGYFISSVSDLSRAEHELKHSFGSGDCPLRYGRNEAVWSLAASRLWRDRSGARREPRPGWRTVVWAFI